MAASSAAYRAAAQAGLSPSAMASPARIGCRLASGIGMPAMGITLDSGWSAGTNRSSPHQVWIRDQSSVSRSGASRSAA